MTRKQFELVAEIISKIENVNEREQMAKRAADSFARQNSRFKRSKFMTACGVDASC